MTQPVIPRSKWIHTIVVILQGGVRHVMYFASRDQMRIASDLLQHHMTEPLRFVVSTLDGWAVFDGAYIIALSCVSEKLPDLDGDDL